jgi:hypothetical protein
MLNPTKVYETLAPAQPFHQEADHTVGVQISSKLKPQNNKAQKNATGIGAEVVAKAPS